MYVCLSIFKESSNLEMLFVFEPLLVSIQTIQQTRFRYNKHKEHKSSKEGQ